MPQLTRRAPSALVVALAAALTLVGCGGSSNDDSSNDAGGDDSSARTLVVDASFDLKTADPGRQYETTGSIVTKALYETLLTFDGDDVTQPVDGLASYEMSDDDRVLTLTMNEGHTFSDGSEVTVDDAVFSLQRVQGMMGNPSFLLDGVTVEKTSDTTLTLTSDEPYPALPFILPNPTLSVLNQDVVEANGGSTDESDAAEAFLNGESAGSGPYILDSFDAASQVVFTANPEYSGEAPAYGRVVLRNVEGETQRLNVQAGESHIALDLNPDQVAQLDADSVNVIASASRFVIFLFLNQDDEVSTVTSDPDFLEAAKLAINYDSIVDLAGEGAVRPGGFIPSLFNGALDAGAGNQRDLDAAQAALDASGYSGEQVTLGFPNDITVQGMSLQSIAESVQAQLGEVGINVTLAPAPVATELDAYRGGTVEFGLWYWGPDFPDASNYLAFTPGELVGLRAGWTVDDDPTVADLAQAARVATGDDERATAYQELQVAQNASGPFIPLLQPAQNVATATSIESISLNPVWTIDLGKTR
ncbi:ABC transporter substrate-binding protein [Phytoactinopolyspora limicola]|uniref:ABC transporter substrate-binding protein n=1 Tax=Phytoactinopolyspora limicola TaxID=2715536 RepID=UPI00140DB422|nr:ABC transporter substrate-binding protein [Phytoactinopolyspora limicola]